MNDKITRMLKCFFCRERVGSTCHSSPPENVRQSQCLTNSPLYSPHTFSNTHTIFSDHLDLKSIFWERYQACNRYADLIEFSWHSSINNSVVQLVLMKKKASTALSWVNEQVLIGSSLGRHVARVTASTKAPIVWCARGWRLGLGLSRVSFVGPSNLSTLQSPKGFRVEHIIRSSAPRPGFYTDYQTAKPATGN